MTKIYLPLSEVGVKAFIIENGKFLFLKRSNSCPKRISGKWDIAGGRIKPGEPFKRVLKREIEEETGLVLKKIEKILAVQDITAQNQDI